MMFYIFMAFLFITFAIHYSLVLIVVGTPILVLVDRFLPFKDKTGAVDLLKTHYPICVSFTITTAIAPLLFSQVLFHRSFYQTFINFYPFPLVFLLLLIIFFYLSYIPKFKPAMTIPVVAAQTLFTIFFIISLSSLFHGITHPAGHSEIFWAGKMPFINWHMLPVHLILATVSSYLFFYFLRSKNLKLRNLCEKLEDGILKKKLKTISPHEHRLKACGTLLGFGFLMSLLREIIRFFQFGKKYPDLLTTNLDPSFWIFLFFFTFMFWQAFQIMRLEKQKK
ncbi:hypothetical protein ACFL35_03835 [Candidatus Riflebacteria bacterium]